MSTVLSTLSSYSSVRRFSLERLLAFALLLTSLASCAGSGTSAERITLRDYKTDRGQRDFEIASKSYGDELEYYSTARRDAPRKYVEDDVMEALSDHLMKHGMKERAQDGAAPKRPDSHGLLRFAFEWSVGDSVQHWPIALPLRGSAAPSGLAGEMQDFKGCQQMFLEVYNATASYQAIQNASGKDIFEEEQRRLMQERREKARRRN